MNLFHHLRLGKSIGIEPIKLNGHIHDYNVVFDRKIFGIRIEILRCKTCGHISIGWYRRSAPEFY